MLLKIKIALLWNLVDLLFHLSKSKRNVHLEKAKSELSVSWHLWVVSDGGLMAFCKTMIYNTLKSKCEKDYMYHQAVLICILVALSVLRSWDWFPGNTHNDTTYEYIITHTGCQMSKYKCCLGVWYSTFISICVCSICSKILPIHTVCFNKRSLL